MTERWRRMSNTEVEALGLGDVIEAATRKFGLKPCRGCKRRRDALNRLAPTLLRRRRRP